LSYTVGIILHFFKDALGSSTLKTVLFLLNRGGFMLSVVPHKDREVAEVIDFREVAPLAATKDMFHGNGSLASWVRIKL